VPKKLLKRHLPVETVTGRLSVAGKSPSDPDGFRQLAQKLLAAKLLPA